MKTEKILDFENNGVCMAVDGSFLYLGSFGTIHKYRLGDMQPKARIEISKKKKNTKYGYFNFSIFDDYIFACDFCDLHIIDKNNMQLLFTVRLGQNISSDIMGVWDYIAPCAYVGIRNGKVEYSIWKPGKPSGMMSAVPAVGAVVSAVTAFITARQRARYWNWTGIPCGPSGRFN